MSTVPLMCVCARVGEDAVMAGRDGGRIESHAIVLNDNLDLVVFLGHGDARVVRLGVTQHVGEAFADTAEYVIGGRRRYGAFERQCHRAAHARRAFEPADLLTGLTCPQERYHILC